MLWSSFSWIIDYRLNNLQKKPVSKSTMFTLALLYLAGLMNETISGKIVSMICTKQFTAWSFDPKIKLNVIFERCLPLVLCKIFCLAVYCSIQTNQTMIFLAQFFFTSHIFTCLKRVSVQTRFQSTFLINNLEDLHHRMKVLF